MARRRCRPTDTRPGDPLDRGPEPIRGAVRRRRGDRQRQRAPRERSPLGRRGSHPERPPGLERERARVHGVAAVLPMAGPPEEVSIIEDDVHVVVRRASAWRSSGCGPRCRHASVPLPLNGSLRPLPGVPARFDARRPPGSRRLVRPARPSGRRRTRSGPSTGRSRRGQRLMDDARSTLLTGRDAVAGQHPGRLLRGVSPGCAEGYAEARLTEAVVSGSPLPGPDELGVESGPPI